MTGRNPIGAYKVETFDSERAVIVYARNPMEARRLGAAELDYYDEEREYSVERTPEWDDGYDTRALLDAGWHWECGGCYRYCYGSDPHLVIRDDVAYCSAACCIKELKRVRARREQEWRGIELVTRQAPGAEIRSVYSNVAGDVIAEIVRPETGHRTVERFVEENMIVKTATDVVSMTGREAKLAKEFRALHDHRDMPDMPEDGFVYEIAETGLAPKLVIRCRCGDSLDITDYETW